MSGWSIRPLAPPIIDPKRHLGINNWEALARHLMYFFKSKIVVQAELWVKELETECRVQVNILVGFLSGIFSPNRDDF